MQEVDVDGASASMAQTTIADELQDAARTAVTQATSQYTKPLYKVDSWNYSRISFDSDYS